MRHDDDVGLFGGVIDFGLQHGINRNVVIGEDAGDVGEHACAVLHREAQVVACFDG